jgi:hypothetical protein
MRTAQVTREFRDKCKELATLSKIPEIKARLSQLAAKYDGLLEEIAPAEAASIAPTEAASMDPTEVVTIHPAEVASMASTNEQT